MPEDSLLTPCSRVSRCKATADPSAPSPSASPSIPAMEVFQRCIPVEGDSAHPSALLTASRCTPPRGHSPFPATAPIGRNTFPHLCAPRCGDPLPVCRCGRQQSPRRRRSLFALSPHPVAAAGTAGTAAQVAAGPALLRTPHRRAPHPLPCRLPLRFSLKRLPKSSFSKALPKHLPKALSCNNFPRYLRTPS